MRFIRALALVLSLAAVAPAGGAPGAQEAQAPPDWDNPAVWAINREAPHAALFPYESRALALARDPARSSYLEPLPPGIHPVHQHEVQRVPGDGRRFPPVALAPVPHHPGGVAAALAKAPVPLELHLLADVAQTPAEEVRPRRSAALHDQDVGRSLGLGEGVGRQRVRAAVDDAARDGVPVVADVRLALVIEVPARHLVRPRLREVECRPQAVV